MVRRTEVIALLVALLALAGHGIAAAAGRDTLRTPPPARLIGRDVPDIELTLADGRRTPLASLWSGQTLLVTFFYRRCSGICTPFLERVRTASREVGGLGSDYRVLAISFDEADGLPDLEAQAAALGLDDDPHWHFARAAPGQLERLVDALEFAYQADAVRGQYDHDALLVAVADGRVVRTLLGSPLDTAPLHELLWELRGRHIPYYRLGDSGPVRCFRFDPLDGTLRPAAGLLVLLLPAALALVLSLAVFAPGRHRPH